MDEASRLPSQSPGVLDTQLSTSEGWKTESTLEPLSAFKIGIPDKEYSFLTTRPLLHCSGILFFFLLKWRLTFVRRFSYIVASVIKGPFSGLKQFLVTKSSFYFTLKALFVLEIFKFLSLHIGQVKKQLDLKAKVDFKFMTS